MYVTGLTQKEICKILGVARRTVQDWLAGLNAIPKPMGRALRSIARHPDYAAILIDGDTPFDIPKSFRPPARRPGRPKTPQIGTKTYLVGF